MLLLLLQLLSPVLDLGLAVADADCNTSLGKEVHKQGCRERSRKQAGSAAAVGKRGGAEMIQSSTPSTPKWQFTLQPRYEHTGIAIHGFVMMRMNVI